MKNLLMAYENSLPSDILYHLEAQIFLFCSFWATLELHILHKRDGEQLPISREQPLPHTHM